MANRVCDDDRSPNPVEKGDPSQSGMIDTVLFAVVDVLTSLKLTVILLALAIFIVLAGTMAQVSKDIWQVTDEFFRTPLAWVDLQIFFPPHWFPGLPAVPGRIPFPGGWLIGFLMAINLLTTYIVRLQVNARGPRLAAGVAILALGSLMTWLVIVSGSNKDDTGNITEIEWSTLWLLIQAGLAGLGLAAIYGLIRIDRARKVECWILLATVAGVGSLLGWAWVNGATINESSLRILWQLIKGGLASLFLLAGCGLLFSKRAGIVLLHSGILLMMLGELLVGTQAVEGNMRIEEGQTTNFIEQARALEVAVVDSSDPAVDSVVAIPAGMLQPGKTIGHESLPFDLKVLKRFASSPLRKATTGADNLATAGTGLFQVVVQEPAVDSVNNEVHGASLYMEFRSKDNAKFLGTYLLAQVQSAKGITEKVLVDGKEYQVTLRPKRIYKPYSVRLVDFRFDKFLGTDKAKNFSSDLHLTDPSRGVDREVKVWMNNPLRYAGDTFYQSGFDRDRETGAEITILQVVSNTGWMIPYVSCVMVAMGMLVHFGIVLLRFLKRRASKEGASRKEASVEGVGNRTTRPEKLKPRRARGAVIWFPALVAAGSILLLGSLARSPKTPDGDMQVDQFGKFPLVYEGRIKPFDTLARNSLTKISNQQTFKDEAGKRQPAIRWLLDLISGKPETDHHKVFRIENMDVLNTLGLERRKGFRYSWDEVRKESVEFSKQVKLARAGKKEELSVYQRKLLELMTKVQLFRLLQESFLLPQIRDGHEAEDLPAARQHAETLVRYQPPLAVPVPAAPNGVPNGAWQPFSSAWTAAEEARQSGKEPNRATVLLADMLRAYRTGETAAPNFNQGVAQYRQLLSSSPPEQLDASKIEIEAWFNHWQPFFWCAIFYVLAFILSALAWLGWSEPLNRAAFWMIAVTFAAHTIALIARIYISGRPPVTNLYSSAVFIGWGCVVLGLVIESIYRLGVGNLLAEVAGFTTLLVAFFLARQGDTFVVLQAVLDTQFWLATHVTCITLGYSTTFVAGGLGILYVFRGVCTPSLTPQVGKELARMIYGAVCFSIFFSFVGTVLGGLWADDSWGRFWGWDPKENGALMIVLWNALVLHSRWRGLVKDRGLALLAIGGNICTAWSWFGVNELGVGLHSYGFTEGVLLGMGIFCLTQLAMIGIGLLPTRLWWSFRKQGAV
jgi:ABC-type transport system involved in cytochrome c biogenesis permease subunit